MQPRVFIPARLIPAPLIRPLILSGLLALGMTLTGCAPLIVGGVAATSASVASDRRSVGEQVDDKAIQMKVSVKLSELLSERGRYNVVSYAGRVLLLGDVPSDVVKQQAEQATSEVERVREVVNRLRIGMALQTDHTWLTTKVTGHLINSANVPARTISVTTERGVVYLMGKVTAAEAQLAARAASSVNGVNQVVTLFHIDNTLVGSAAAGARTQAVAQDSAPTPADPPSAQPPIQPQTQPGEPNAEQTTPSPVQALPIH